MMGNHVITVTRFARRHPKATGSAALFAARHWRGVADIARATRHGTRVARQGRALIGNISEPGLREEVRAAFDELSAAVERSRQVGVENALTDKEVSKRLNRASDHASSIWTHLASAQDGTTKKRHRRLLGTLVLGAALLAGVWRARRTPTFS